MYKIRASGLVDRTQVDVLEALAFFQNSDSGACFPSTEAIARVSRVNDRLVRTTLKKLHDLGYVSSEQQSGQRRYFTLHLDRLPKPVNETTPLNKTTPLYETAPLYESTGEGCRKVQGTPVGKCRGPLYKTTAESVIEQVINKEEEQGSLPAQALWETDHLTNDGKKVEKPKRQATDKGSRLSITELPDDWKAFAEQEEPDLDPKRLFENFHDYWNGLSGAKAIKKDWTATWRNFVRSFHNAEDWKRRPMLKRAPTHSPSRPGQFVEKKQSERDYFDW
nr:MAG TPA: helix-turn-helix domain protein [Caudoviricetes sp.]